MTQSIPPSTYEAVLRLVRERTGLSFGQSRYETAIAGISRAMRRAGNPPLESYIAALDVDRKRMDDLVGELTVGETYFFREPDQYDFIRRQVLPEIRQRRGLNHTIRAWSAGCASGEEAYSLAILFAEEGLAKNSHILATDISPVGLAKARQAVFGKWSLRGEGADRARPYLQPRGNVLVLEESIRKGVTFEHLNLALDVYPSFGTGTWGMDLILCRNVLIYFDSDTVRQTARRLFDSLAPGGWLFTASSDPPLNNDAAFETVVSDYGVFYRRPVEAVLTTEKAVFAPSIPSPLSKFPLPEKRRDTDLRTRPASRPLSERPPAKKDVDADEFLAEARRAFERGDYERASQLAAKASDSLPACILKVRSLANLENSQAQQACAEAILRHPLSGELHYLNSVLLLELNQDEAAIQEIRRVIFLDRRLAIAHFTLGSILEKKSHIAEARKAYRNAYDLCVARPVDEVLPLSDGEKAGRLAEAALARMAVLDAIQEVSA